MAELNATEPETAVYVYEQRQRNARLLVISLSVTTYLIEKTKGKKC